MKLACGVAMLSVFAIYMFVVLLAIHPQSGQAQVTAQAGQPFRLRPAIPIACRRPNLDASRSASIDPGIYRWAAPTQFDARMPVFSGMAECSPIQPPP